MDLLAELRADECTLLRIFQRHGPDGRAIRTESLAVHGEFGNDRERLSAALATLEAKGLISEAGYDPLTTVHHSAFRLTRALPPLGVGATD